MFHKRDGAFFTVLHGGPVRFGQHRPRQPVRIHGVVVDAAQINIGRDGTGFQHGQKMFGGGFNQFALPERFEESPGKTLEDFIAKIRREAR